MKDHQWDCTLLPAQNDSSGAQSRSPNGIYAKQGTHDDASCILKLDWVLSCERSRHPSVGREEVCLKERLCGAMGVSSVHGTDGATYKGRKGSFRHWHDIRSAPLRRSRQVALKSSPGALGG